MNAIEFNAYIENGIIHLPKNAADWNGKKIKVILLDHTSDNEHEQATTAEQDFFSIAGIWSNCDITQTSLRNEAWRRKQT